MRLRFNGGPWDGVEFESPIRPDQIRFRHLDTRFEQVPGKPLEEFMHFAKREHHQYNFDRPKLLENVELQVGLNLQRWPADGEHIEDLVDQGLLVMHYRHAPGELLDWEKYGLAAEE